MPTNKETNSNINIHFDGKDIRARRDVSIDLEVGVGDRKGNRIRSNESIHLDVAKRARRRGDSYAKDGTMIDIRFEEKSGPNSHPTAEEPSDFDFNLNGRDFNARFAFGKHEALNIMAKVSSQSRIYFNIYHFDVHTFHPMSFRLKVGW